MTEIDQFRVLITYPNLYMSLTPSYAVGLFTSVLKAQGYTVDLFDCTAYEATHEFVEESGSVTRANTLMASRKFDADRLYGSAKTDLAGDYKRKLEEFQPHAVIFSTVVEDTWPQACDLLEILAQYPDIKSIIGGVYTTMAPDDAMTNPYVQCIGEGEGEQTIVEFCEAVRNHVAPVNIPGTRARGEDRRVIRNPKRELLDINDVVPDFSLFDEDRFRRPIGAKIWKVIPIESYRGCPYTCAFCNSPQQVILAKESGQGLYLRRKSMTTLRRELDTMIERYNPTFIYINDDAFMARPKREIWEFAQMYRDIGLPFWFQTRFEDISEEKLTWLKEVGAYRISFGLEHGNEKFRREKLLRNMSNEFILEQAKILPEVGIPYSVNVIIGMPYETRELYFDTVRLVRAVGSFDSIAANIYAPYRGTKLRSMAIKEGWLDPEKHATSFIAKSILKMPSHYLQPDEMLGLQRAFPLYATMDESRFAEIERAETFDEIGNELFTALADEYYTQKYGTSEADRMLTYVG